MVDHLFQDERKGGIMEFKKNQTIYLQIADFICENILTEKWPVEEKISSVRELAAMIEVNPNTVMRTYRYLQDRGIIYNKRGIGFFVAGDAPSNIQNIEKESFLKTEIPELFRKLDMLKMNFSDLEELYKTYRQNGKN